MTCPKYYLTANGEEFYQFYAANCTPLVQDVLTYDQAHALASACEYVFRSGRKTPDPREDMRKAHSLLKRIDDLEVHSSEVIERVVSQVIGLVMRAKIEAEIADEPKTVDLTDPIITAWGRFQ